MNKQSKQKIIIKSEECILLNKIDSKTKNIDGKKMAINKSPSKLIKDTQVRNNNQDKYLASRTKCFK